MEITGTQTIAAPRQKIWDALIDPQILKRSLPGCESVERLSAEEFKVIVVAAIGPLRARFNGRLLMTKVQAPESCTMVFEGQGGAVGFGKGNSRVKLTEVNGQTEMTYTAEAQVGGKLAQVGSRLIDNVARKMADDFFKAFKAQLASDGPATNAPEAPAEPNKSLARPATAASQSPAAGPIHASAAASIPAPVSGAPASVMVPGWWLAVAAVIGSLATLAGVVLAR